MRASSTHADAGSDAALVAGIAAREERALAALYDAHGAPAFRLAHAITGDDAAAADAVAAAFAHAWREAHTFDPTRSTVRGWLAALVRRCALAHLCAEGGGARTHAARRRARPPATMPALAALPDGARRAIELAYLGGLTLGEIADELHEPEGHVRHLLRAALDALRAPPPRDATLELQPLAGV